MFILKLTPSAGQSNSTITYAFDRIAHYQEKGDVERQVCEMMNTERLLSEMDLNQAEKGQFYMNICLTEVDLSNLTDKSEVLGRAYEYRGIRHYVYGEFELAVASFDASLEILTDYGYQYRIHRWLGVIHCLSENISTGISHYEDAISHAVKYYGEQDPQGDAFIFSLHSNITSVYAKIENFRKARHHAHRALDYAKKITDKSLIATATINEANILINERKANEALLILTGLDTIISNDMQIAANYYNILGTANLQIQNYDLSIKYFKKSNILISNKSVLQESMILNWLAIAEAQYLKESYNKAIETTQNAIQKLEQKTTQFPSSLADAYHLKAKCLIKLGSPNRAEEEIQKAIKIEGPFETWKLPQISTMISVKAAQYQNTQEEQYLLDLINYQEMADSLILDLQVKHRHHEDEVNLNEYIYNVYSNNLRVISILEKEFPKKIDSEMIFKYMETLKSLRLRKERKANIQGLNIPNDLMNQVSELKYSLIKLQKDRFELQQSKKETIQIDSIYTHTKYQYYAVLDILEAEYPQYYKGQYQKLNSDLKSVQDRLKPNDVIIEYFIADSSIHSIGITSDSLHFISIPKPNNWNELIDEFRKAISDFDYISQPNRYQEVFDVFSLHSNTLFELLLKDMLSLLPKETNVIKIIPDNELYHIPFELLLTSKSESNSYQALDYVGLSYTISYSESTSYLFQANHFSYDKTYVVIAPDYTIEKENLITLPHSYKSANEISEQLNGTILTRDKESQDFFSTTASSNIFHFAGHASISEDPSLSRMMLNENAIYTEDIYQTEIENQLTILSACNTGNGEFINGRGLQSLSRAFRFAGAQSTIQSLWPVPDLQTSKINNKIIAYLSTGMNIQNALQQSKFDLLDKSPKLYSHPFYWAGFVTFGNTNQFVDLDHKNNNVFWFFMFIILLTALAFLLTKYYRRNNFK